jgi:hypothetical protein
VARTVGRSHRERIFDLNRERFMMDVLEQVDPFIGQQQAHPLAQRKRSLRPPIGALLLLFKIIEPSRDLIGHESRRHPCFRDLDEPMLNPPKGPDESANQHHGASICECMEPPDLRGFCNREQLVPLENMLELRVQLHLIHFHQKWTVN